MSAKWRRNKRSPKRFDIFKVFSRGKEKATSSRPRTKAPTVKRWSQSRGLRVQDMSGEKKPRNKDSLIDIFDDDDDITVVAEFAGFSRENLKINVKDQKLTLSAKASDRKYHKSLNLPKRVIPSTIRTTYKNGVLEIRLKKVGEEKTIDKVAG